MDNVQVTFDFKGNADEQLQKLQLTLKGVDDESSKTFQRLINDSTTAFDAMNEENRRLAVTIQSSITALNNLSAVSKGLDDGYRDGTVTAEQYNKAKASLAMQEAALRTEVNESIKTLNERTRTEQVEGDSINQLQLKIQKLTEAYYNMSKADREGVKGQGILNDLKSLDKEMSNAQTKLAQSGRSGVAGFNTLNFSIQQVARELPSLTMGANMFFLAISNNLPILADNIKAARIEYAALKAEGQAATPVWKQVLSSIVSWQTAMVVGITLLTIYGKDIINWVSGLFSANKAQKDLNESMTNYNSILAKEQQNLKYLFQVAEKAKEGTEGRKKAIDSINSAFGKYLPNLLSEKSTVMELSAAYDVVNKALREHAALKAQGAAIDKVMDESVKKQSDLLTSMRNTAQKKTGSISGSIIDQVTSMTEELQKSGQGWEKTWRDISFKIMQMSGSKKLGGSFYEDLSGYIRSYYDSTKKISELQTQFDPFMNKDKSNKALTHNKEYWEDVKKQATSVLESIDAKQKKILDSGKTTGISSEVVNKYKQAKKDIDEASSSLKAYDSYDKQQSASDKVNRDMNARLDKARELAEKEKQIEYEKAQYKIEMEEKEVNSLDDSYEKRYKLAEIEYKKELLSIKKYGDDRLQALQEAEKTEWESNGKKGTFIPKISKLPDEVQSQLDQMQTAALKTFQKTNSDITKDMNAEFVSERTRFASELQKELSDIEANYAERIRAAKGNAELIAQLEKNKQTEIRQATSSHTIKMISFYSELAKTRMEIANKQYLFESDRLKAQIVEEKKAAEATLAVLEQEYALNPTDELAMEIEQAKVKLEGFNKELSDMPTKKLEDVLGLFGSIFQELGNLDGDVGQFFSSMATQVGNLQTIFSKTATQADKISAGVAGLVSVVNMLTSASSKRKATEKEFYKNAIAMAQEYALALNEQLRLQTQLSDSVFVTDYAGKIKDGFAAITDAETKYQTAIKKLNEGKAKISLRNSVDWGNVGMGAAGGAAAGAAAGAVLGSVVPVVGTVIGAGVGALAGLIFGTKKKANKAGLLDVFPELVDGAGNLNKELAQSVINTDQVDDKTKQLLQNAIDWADAIKEANDQIKEVVKDLAGDLGTNLKDALVTAWETGGDASQAMFKKAGESLQDFVTNMLYSTVFSDIFSSFQDRLTASLNPVSGDGDVIDDYDWLMEQMNSRSATFTQLLEAIKTRANEKGYDMFNNTDSSSSSTRTATAKGLESVTQDSFNEMLGLAYNYLMYVEKANSGIVGINSVLNNGLSLLARIAANTDRLENIETDMKIIKLNFSDVVNRGLLLRKS